MRRDTAIADGSQRLRAEEEHFEKPTEFRSCIRSLQFHSGNDEIRQGENCVSDQISQKDHSEKSGPRHIDEVEIRMNVPPRDSVPPHVEGSILVDDPPQRRAELLGQARIEGRFIHTTILGHPAGLLIRRRGENQARHFLWLIHLNKMSSIGQEE